MKVSTFDPWRHVSADDDLVTDLLAATVESVHELGGRIHPDAVFVSCRGQLHVTCTDQDDVPLMTLPAEAFLPIDQVQWSTAGDRLEILGMDEHLSGAQRELLMLQTALHNACGKLSWLTTTHPVLAADLPSDVVAAVRKFRPSFRLHQPSAASLMWSNRCFRLPLAGASKAVPVALPLIDLLDHRQGGATGTWTGDAFGVTASHPTADERCFLDYGLQRDAIGMAVVYGFVDDSARQAHSAPLTLDLPGVGRVEVLARGRSRTGALQSPVIHRDEQGSRISHLSYRPGGIDDLVRAIAHGSEWSAAQCREVVRAVADANVRLLESLIESARRPTDSPAALTLVGAALHQRELISQAIDSP